MKVLLLRLDAPMVSFGAPMVDQYGVVQAFPALSMLTGLIANALGWIHQDVDKLEALQNRLHYAARTDRRGEAFVDYQTVDLGLPWMLPERAGWTTRGVLASRGGGSSDGTHIRFRHYRADSVHTVALTLEGSDEPTLEQVKSVLEEPARPLFLGRKCCLPSTPLLLRVGEADSLLAALRDEPRAARADTGPLPVWWSDGDDASAASGASRVISVTDERDWANQIHVGRRLMHEGHVTPPEAPGV